MDFEGVSNMRATDWCLSRVRDVAERLLIESKVLLGWSNGQR